MKAREKAVVDTLRLTSEICTQRHHDGLFRKIKEHLPHFFGFESVGVLIYNFQTAWLFTDPDHSAKESSTPGSDNEEEFKKPKVMDEEEAEKEKDLHHKKFTNFPCNSGLSGAVFASGEVYISNNAAKETKFRDEIDNQSGTTDIRNFMIGPVYGERKDIPCGIIQFINKRAGQPITPADELKFKAMQGLLGMCIDNTNEMALTISVTLDVSDVMKRINDIMSRDQMQEEEYQENESKIQGLSDHIKNIRDTYNKLLDDRAKAKNAI